MNILFLVYWGLNDGLTASTVLPHIRILERNKKIRRIILCTIERDFFLEEGKLGEKVMHIPWISAHHYSKKVRDFTVLPETLIKIIEKFNVQFMICRGTPAGAIGYLVNQKTKIQYAVESFEPHADYMRESGLWGWWDLRYILQRYWEKRQIRTARYLMPVTRNYHDFLIGRKVDPSKLFIMPCAVDLERFAFNQKDRILIRKRLGVADDVILGIYVGKFGGLYYDEEAFRIFSRAKKVFGKFQLIILSPDDENSVVSKLLSVGYLTGEFHIKHTAHSEVPAYLSASDFAFATYKHGYFKRYLSPVKIGEYWAAGLPVLLTDGVGDDHLIIKELNIGSVFTNTDKDLANAFINLKAILKEGRVQVNLRIQPVASKYRNLEQNKLAYDKIIDALC